MSSQFVSTTYTEARSQTRNCEALISNCKHDQKQRFDFFFYGINLEQKRKPTYTKCRKGKSPTDVPVNDQGQAGYMETTKHSDVKNKIVLDRYICNISRLKCFAV